MTGSLNVIPVAIEKYFVKQGIKIQNITPGSLIMAYGFNSIQNILKSDGGCK